MGIISKTENIRNCARELFNLVTLSLDARLSRDSFRAYKAVREFYMIILFSCLLGMSMITDGVTTMDEIEGAISADPSRLLHLFIRLLVAILLIRLGIYYLRSAMNNEKLDWRRVSTYMAGFGAALTGYSWAAGSDFVARASEEFGTGSLVFIWVFGYFVAKVWACLLERIICMLLIKRGGLHDKNSAADDR